MVGVEVVVEVEVEVGVVVVVVVGVVVGVEVEVVVEVEVEVGVVVVVVVGVGVVVVVVVGVEVARRSKVMTDEEKLPYPFDRVLRGTGEKYAYLCAEEGGSKEDHYFIPESEARAMLKRLKMLEDICRMMLAYWEVEIQKKEIDIPVFAIEGSLHSVIVISINTLGASIEDRSFVAVLKNIGNQYNYDNSEIETDYFDKRFFFRVQLDGGRGV